MTFASMRYVYMYLVVLPHLDAAVMPYERWQFKIKLDMEKKLHNFYVVDPLKSVETGELAVRLLRDVKAMCETGGFHLTKFMSNKETVIQ